MNEENKTIATEFLLLGFHRLGVFKTVVFLFILAAYAMMLTINVIIIIIVSTRERLCSPMFFFLKHFLCSEMLAVSIIVPNMLRVIWLNGATLSISGCIAQSYLYCAAGTTECYLLTAMSYDRYLAICNPLRYNTIMNVSLQYFFVIFCWMFGFSLSLITLSFLVTLQSCEPNIIDHYFCDPVNYIDLACSDSSALQIEILALSIPIIVIPFILVLVSYFCVFVTILGMCSMTGKKKAFSTCSSHLSVVSIFFGTLIVIYLVPAKGHSRAINKAISVMYIVVTPLINPVIYSMRNQEIRAVMGTLINLKMNNRNQLEQ